MYWNHACFQTGVENSPTVLRGHKWLQRMSSVKLKHYDNSVGLKAQQPVEFIQSGRMHVQEIFCSNNGNPPPANSYIKFLY